ncbi:PHP family metal-dependent phosphoesterase [Prochlorococcus marinus str. SS51]|uniref:PHP family metal-dependent phosphoesterase n=2 Tax=Prochlorococcaceae TaxID=2881426 RepID=Q7VBY6_PROMA|nr:PHP domain-containing protein [Prochlorococcus marinus]AAQ00001.1 PHP family metal-dependent phosphoesterase [Prochlorococcus marinus subsp. marinus str. CCMP1375]KGG23529.1 PHP family metal-dependent phosphoesterase [Prochlorococcus marinus str. SS35]KGG32235.1 PHP family metal-dependent phosphoesterase [Prochlorococcus marinus str. SS51]
MILNNHPMFATISSIDHNSCPRHINFHCHSTLSDGSMNPIDLIVQASKLKLKHLAVTDHHNINAYAIISEWISSNQNTISIPAFWSGIEISCLLKGCLVHIIGLGFDTHAKSLLPYITGEAPRGTDLQAEQVIKAIKAANGISILAHPARYRLNFEILIKEAKSLGINGVEVWYDYDFLKEWRSTTLICDSILAIAKANNLLKTCGTDTHGYSLLGR